MPPASSMALSKAFLLSVRFSPLLRGRSGLPSSARRLDKAALNAGKSTRRPVQLSSAFKRFNAIFVYRFFADTAFQIADIGLIMRDKQPLRLFAPNLPLSPCGRRGPKGRRGGRAALVALRLYLVRGISARKRAPHPHPSPPPSRGRGFWFTQESKTARGQPQRRGGG